MSNEAVVGSLSADKVRFNTFEVTVSNLLAGICKIPFDTMLLTDNLRSSLLQKVQGECLETVDIHTLDGRNIKAVKTLLDYFGKERGNLHRLLYLAFLYDTFLEGVFTVAGKNLKDGVVVYTVDLSPEEEFSTYCFLCKDEIEDTYALITELAEDSSFGPPTLFDSTMSNLDRVLMCADFVEGKAGAPVGLEVSLSEKGKERNYTELSEDEVKKILDDKGYHVYYYMEDDVPVYVMLPSGSLQKRCAFSRSFNSLNIMENLDADEQWI